MCRVQILFLVEILMLTIHANCVAIKASCNCANACRAPNVQARIVGGLEPHQLSHPWAVALMKKNILYCGATIISKSFILTAAHCIYVFDPKDILIVIGSHKLDERTDVTRDVKTIAHHERFDVVSFNNDIGLIEINTPISFGHNIKPACLPNYKGTSSYSGKLGLVFGWGREGENKELASVIKYIYVPIFSQQKCAKFGYGPKRLTSNMFCAGYEDGRYDACQGDSGGSMVQLLPSGGAEVIGIISWGRGCARPNFPGIYTVVGKYRQWVERNMASDCECAM